MKRIFLMFGLFLGVASPLLAMPKNVIIIRHADKLPPEGCLSRQGLERAAALAFYFSESPEFNDPPISHIFAAYKEGPPPYIRAKQTCSPIAEHLNLPLNTNFKMADVKEIAHELLTNAAYNNSTVLLCWDHLHIAPIVVALGGEDPGKWDKDIFDQVYMLTFQGPGKPKFQQFLQKLMFGDRTTFQDNPHPLPPLFAQCPGEDRVETKNVADLR